MKFEFGNEHFLAAIYANLSPYYLTFGLILNLE